MTMRMTVINDDDDVAVEGELYFEATMNEPVSVGMGRVQYTQIKQT